MPTRTLNNTMRIQAVADTGLMDVGDVVGFDGYVRLASFVAHAPVAYLSFIDADRQVIKSHLGLSEENAARDHPVDLAMCSRVVLADGPVWHCDVRGDAAASALWTFRGTGAVAYAGVPVHDGRGLALGVLAVLDFEPRDWSPALIAALTDVAAAVTEYIRLRNAEREVARGRAWRAAVFESITEGFFLVDHDWRFTYVNGHAAEMIQETPDALVGEDLWQVFPNIVGGPCEEALRRSLAEHLAVAFDFHVEPSDRSPDGRWIAIRAYPNVEGLAVFFLDISARRLAEAELAEADRHKLSAMTRMAGAIAHHVNNLLTGVRGVAEMLLASDISPALREDMQHIMEATQRSVTLTQKLLSYSGKQVLRSVVLDLNDAVRDDLELHADLDRAGVAVELALAADAVWVQADPLRLEQVLTVLIDNAKEAMPEGGTLAIATHVTEVTLDMPEAAKLPAGPYAVLAVHDTGWGMAADQHRRVFEPFFSTKGTRTPTTGMGLALARGLVVQSHGEIFLDSQPGRGAEFRVYLPRVPAVASIPAAATSAREAAPVTGSGLVLLAEDEPLLRKLATKLLEHAGFEVLAAADGIEALEIAARTPNIDLVLTDVVMPRMGGLQLAARLRAKRADVPILFMSGYAEDVLTDSLRHGRTRFLPKPYTGDALVQAARELLAVKAEADKLP